uniref:Uncharacterized protein n=1 Tax=Schistosoma japonicum TaxID=6182 RepID=Q5C2Q2_SCHJA|nr:unknown [Schistosoma japonicum]
MEHLINSRVHRFHQSVLNHLTIYQNH